MKLMNSALFMATLTEGLGIYDLPLRNRSERWGDMFWHYVGLAEAQRLKEKA